ncbi:MAG: pectate lyase [Verrucomicrobiales bacterium]|nr:pectate lyase [Verrucomicrobiales bacterium]
MNSVFRLLPALFLLFTGILPGADDPKADDALGAMKKAVHYFRGNLSVQGGYASEWKLNPVVGYTEHRSGPTVFSIQPSGTTTIGLAMLRAWQATGEKEFLTGAVETGRALALCQLSSGGWTSSFDFDPDFASKYHLRSDLDSGDTEPGKRKIRSTLDDNKTQSALLLMLELAVLPETAGDKEIQRAWAFGLESLIAAQRPDGGWPQQFDGPANADLPVRKASYPEQWSKKWPKPRYEHFVTLNDGNLYHVMHLLLRAHELTGSEQAFASAEKLGDFFLRAQMPDPQPAWAQQYDENMHPTWARKFEPPAISSVESFSTTEALLVLWAATGKETYRKAIFPALDWLESVQLDNGKWARFYELETGRPLYCEAETYKVTYDDSNLPTHYGFQISDFSYKIKRMRDELAMDSETVARKRKGPTQPESFAKKARGLRGKVKAALEKQHPEGYWMKDGRVDAREFVRHMSAMTQYVDAVKKSEKK